MRQYTYAVSKNERKLGAVRIGIQDMFENLVYWGKSRPTADHVDAGRCKLPGVSAFHLKFT